MSQYYNTNTNTLQTMPPWGNSWVSNDIKQTYYDAGWELKDDDFAPPQPPDSTYAWDATTKSYVLDKHLTRLSLDAEYDAYNVQNMKAYMGALKRGDTAMAATILSEGTALNTEYYTKKEALK